MLTFRSFREDSVWGWRQEPPGGAVLGITSRPRYDVGLLDPPEAVAFGTRAAMIGLLSLVRRSSVVGFSLRRLSPHCPRRCAAAEVPVAFCREPVLVAVWPVAVADALESAFVDEAVQPIGEQIVSDPQALSPLIEAAKAEEDVADDQ
jgi:hypothetical protein